MQPDYYEFFNQAKIMSGVKALDHIPVELDGFNARQPLVITSKKISKAGLAKNLIKAFCDSNVVIGALFDDAPPYASIGLIRELAKLFRDRGCDSVIGIGGGAIMDIAKGVNILASEKTDDLLQFQGVNVLKSHLKPLIYIPTATSDGYESSNEARIEKRLFKSDFLFPDLIVADRKMVGIGGEDRPVEAGLVALTHSIEACTAGNQNPVNDAYAYGAIQFIYENLPAVAKRGGGRKNYLPLANAAAIAGIVYSNAPAGTVHRLGSAIAKETGLSEGICFGLLLVPVLEQKVAKKGVRGELLQALAGLDAYSGTLESERPARAVGLVRDMIRNMKLPKSFAELRIPRYRLDKAVKDAVAAGGGDLKEKECMAIADSAFDGAPVQ